MKATVLIAGLVFSACVSVASAQTVREDVLLIERVKMAHGITLPARGTLMSQVESQFGAPSVKHPAVGGGSAVQPPITRWDYPTFSVYFENNHVVNAVVRKASALETGPKPVR